MSVIFNFKGFLSSSFRVKRFYKARFTEKKSETIYIC